MPFTESAIVFREFFSICAPIPDMVPRVVILMGVSGCGKSTVGQLLAQEIGARFFDGDDFHTSDNIAKMSNGIPLTDADRFPWLERIRRELIDSAPAGRTTIIACSALKRSYRDILRRGNDGVFFIHLSIPFDVAAARLESRQGHFMKRDLLESQFAVLEEPMDEPLSFSLMNRRDSTLIRRIKRILFQQ